MTIETVRVLLVLLCCVVALLVFNIHIINKNIADIAKWMKKINKKMYGLEDEENNNN